MGARGYSTFLSSDLCYRYFYTCRFVVRMKLDDLRQFLAPVPAGRQVGGPLGNEWVSGHVAGAKVGNFAAYLAHFDRTGLRMQRRRSTRRFGRGKGAGRELNPAGSAGWGRRLAVGAPQIKG